MAQRAVAVVTGASAGVGRATVRAFAERGYAVAMLARESEGLRNAAAEVESRGVPSAAIPTEVADHEQVEGAGARVAAELGPIDVWVNNAMTGVFAESWDVEPVEFRRVTEVTYLGVVYGTLTALAHMRGQHRERPGHIIQVGSALAYRAIPLQSAYCAAKHAIQGFTEAVRAELYHEHSQLTLTMVQLPGLNTPQFRQLRSKMRKEAQPMPPIYQPEVAARAIVWASEQQRPEVWVGGSTVKTILANRVAPRLLDRYLARVGYAGQFVDEPHDPTAPGNLFAAVAGDQGSHGPYGGRSRARSLQLSLTQHRRWLAGAAAGAMAGAAALLRRAAS